MDRIYWTRSPNFERPVESVLMVHLRPQRTDRRQATNNPILFICHSLGGFVLKQALVSAHRSWKDYDALLGALRGLLLVGCLHLQTDQKGEWQRAVGILLSETRDVSARLSTEAELQTLFEVSRQFENAARNIPLLSIYETAQTKLNSAISINSTRPRRLTLIDKHAAKTGLQLEQLVAVEASHGEICLLRDASTRKKVLDFMRDCLNASQHSRETKPPASQSLPLPMKALSQVISISSLALSASPIEENMDVMRNALVGKAMSMPEFATVGYQESKVRDPNLPCTVVDNTIFIEDFISRDDVLDIIDDALDDKNEAASRVRYVALHGIGGIGKTSTAAQYLSTRGTKYEAKFWVRADHHEKIVDGFGRIAVALGLLDDDQTQDTAFNRKVVMDWLENPVRTFDSSQQDSTELVSWLIVFDNVEDIEVLEEFWPKKGGGSIIVTSRNPTTAWRRQDSERRNEGIKMRPFNLDEASRFLQHLAPAAEKRRDPGAADELAKRLDCIPFFLRQMGELIHKRQTTFRRFLELYQSEANQGKLSRFSERPGRRSVSQYDFTISTVWFLERLSPQTLSLINVLALLDPDGIDEAVLMPGDVKLSDDLYPVTLADYEDAKAELSFSSLIININDDDGDEDQIGIHRTVQDAVRAKMSPAQYHAAFGTVVELLLKKWPVKGRMWHYPVDRFPLCEAVSSHLMQIHSHYLLNCAKNECTSPTSAFAQLMIYGGWYWYQRGAADQAKKFFDTSEQLSDRLPDGASLLEDVWMVQGCVATETNDGRGCMEYYTKLRDSILKHTPIPKTTGDHERVASSHNEMGIAYMMANNIEKAKDEFEKARCYALEGQRGSETVLSVVMFATANLGLVYWLQAQYDAALAVLTESYNDWRRQKVRGEKESFMYVVPYPFLHPH